VTDNSIVLDQAIFGYSGGHRLLASSRSMTSEERFVLLRYTDRSSDNAKLPRSGYLTGIPLPTNKVYALVRTWPAPEMDRPGAVWSHVLFIKLADLAAITHLKVLDSLFIRPRLPESLSGDLSPLTVTFPAKKKGLPESFNHQMAASVLVSVYRETGGPAYIAREKGQDIDQLALAIWSQQWPKLRREFSFCTFGEQSRSSSKDEFDLLAGPSPVHFNGLQLEQNLSVADGGGSWLELALRDLDLGDTGLREFLKRVGSDIKQGRRHFQYLCHVFSLLDCEQIEFFESLFVESFERFDENEALMLRKSLIEYGIEHSKRLPLSALLLLSEIVEELPEKGSELFFGVLGKRLWQTEPGRLAMFSRTGALWMEMSKIVEAAPLSLIVKGINKYPTLAHDVLAAAPYLVAQTKMWSRKIGDRTLSFLTDIEDPELVVLGIHAACMANAKHLHSAILKSFSAETIQLAVAQDPNCLSSKVGEDLAMAAIEGHIPQYELINAVLSSTSPSKRVIGALVRNLNLQESYPSPDCGGHWVEAWNRSVGEISKNEELDYFVFVFVCGMSTSGKMSAPLMAASSDAILKAQAGRLLSFDQRSSVDRVIASSPRFNIASAYNRTVKSIAEIAKRQQFAMAEVAALSNDLGTLRDISNFIARTSDGREYLRKVIKRDSSELVEVEKIKALRAPLVKSRRLRRYDNKKD